MGVRDLIKRNIKFAILVAVAAGFSAASLPWSVKINGFFVIVFVVLSSLRIKTLRELREDKTGFLLISLSALYFLLHSVSLIYTTDQKEGLFDLEQKWTFLLLPLCAWLNSKNQNIRRMVLVLFLLSVLLASITCLAISAKINYSENKLWNYPDFGVNEWLFSYKLLAKNIGLHPAYLALYIAVSIVYLMLYVFSDIKLKKKIAASALIVFLFAFMTLLSSRTVLIATLVFLLTVTIYTVSRKRKFGYLLFFILMFIGIILITNINEITRSRMVALSELQNGDITIWGTFDTRFKQWRATLQIIKENPILGIGPGDFQTEIVKIYNQRGWSDLASEKFNSHNQFLQTTASVGMAGLACLLGIAFLSIIRAVSRNDFLYMGFLFVFISFSMTESTLEVQKGIVFFNLLNSVLYFTSGWYDGKEKKEDH